MLQNRVSAPQLTGPEPTAEQIETIMQSALRAPDHARLRPWRYLSIKGDARADLGKVFADSQLAQKPDLTEEQQAKFQNMLCRAPLVIAAIAKIEEHPKVPEIEQILSAGAGVQNMLNATWALGLGAIWRTGDMAADQAVQQALQLQANEQLIGFIYIGHVNCKLKQPPVMETSEFLTEWKL